MAQQRKLGQRHRARREPPSEARGGEEGRGTQGGGGAAVINSRFEAVGYRIGNGRVGAGHGEAAAADLETEPEVTEGERSVREDSARG